MTKYMRDKKMHKAVRLTERGRSRTLCKMQNKTLAFKSTTIDKQVTCENCLEIIKKKLTSK